MENHIIHSFVVVDRVQIIKQISIIIMSWKKQSAAAGLGGLMPREAARAAFQLDCFQNMDNPLPDPDATFGPLFKDVSFDLI